MLPIDSVTGKPWTNVPLWGQISKGLMKRAERELCSRDEDLSRGGMHEGNEWSPSRTEERETDGDTATKIVRVVDPALAAVKHTGADTLKLYKLHVAEFLAESRSQEEYEAKYARDERGEKLAAMVADGREVADSIPPPRPDKAKIPRRRIPTAAKAS